MRAVFLAGVILFGVSASSAGIARAQDTGSISGTVRDESSQPLSEICVAASPPDYEDVDTYYTRTDSSGAYVLVGLPAGQYKVAFIDCNDQQNYFSEWYDDEQDFESADLVTVAAGAQTPGIDAVLTRGGSISGRVTDVAGAPLGDICVLALSSDDAGGFAVTDEDGAYRARPLRGGIYTVAFFDCQHFFLEDWSPPGECANSTKYRSEWYEDKSSMEEADPVSVTLGAETSGIDAVLDLVPSSDLAVTRLSVENVPLRTDDGPVGYTGWSRRVHVTVANHGLGASEQATLRVFACGKTFGCSEIDSLPLDLGAGEAVEKSLDWNALWTGSAGDVSVVARADVSNDGDCGNNEASVDHYAIVGGSGFGVSGP